MIKKFEIIPGTKCNFKCIYCYESPFIKGESNKMSSEVIKASIDYIKKELSLLKGDKGMISFFGGEPLLYTDVIDEFIQELHHLNILFNLISNGSLIQQKQDYILKWHHLLGNRLSFLVSYDYALQDKNRCKGSKSKIINNLHWLDNHGIRFRTNTVFTQEDLPKFSDVYQEYVKLQKELNTKFTFRFGIDNVNYCNKQTEYRITVPSNLGKVVFKYGKISPTNNRLHSCGWGNRVVAGINWNGDLYPCQGAIFDPNKDRVKLGSVFDSFDEIQRNKKNLFNLFPRKRNPKCETCTAVCKICPLETLTEDPATFDTMPKEEHCKLQNFITKALHL